MQPEVFQDRLSLARERRCPFQFVKDYFGSVSISRTRNT